ncbi:MAG: hypothetical protein R3E96_03950 [Planctomycetota bacterium]
MRGRTSVTFENPTQQSLEVSMALESADSRWRFSPDHVHGSLAPGQRLVLEAAVQRDGARSTTPSACPRHAWPSTCCNPARGIPCPIAPSTCRSAWSSTRRTSPAARWPSTCASATPSWRSPTPTWPCPTGPVGRMLAARGEHRQTARPGGQNRILEFALSLDEGHPGFFVHLDGKYAIAQAKDVTLERNRWYHLAGVFDGQKCACTWTAARSRPKPPMACAPATACRSSSAAM